jgi:hypothetical protein
MSSWYFGSSNALYFDMISQNSKLHRFQIIIKPDLSAASLHFINTSELSLHDLKYLFLADYKICEDTLLFYTFYNYHDETGHYEFGVHTGLTSTRFTINTLQAAKDLLPGFTRPECRPFSCPASGRFVILDCSNNVVVLDFF